MIARSTAFLRAIFCAFLLVTALSEERSLSSEVPLGERVVARVNDAPIPYSAIRANRDLVATALPLNATPDAIDEAVHAQEVNSLVRAIRGCIEDAVLGPIERTIDAATVRTAIEAKFEKGGLTAEVAGKIVGELRQVVAALEWMIRTGGSSEEAYKQFLASTAVSELTWRQYATIYRTPAKLDELRKRIPADMEGMKAESMAATRRDLAKEKLASEITPEVIISPEEVRKAYEAQYARTQPNPPLEAVEHELRAQLVAKQRHAAMREFFDVQIRDAKIEIVDDAFKDALDILLPNAPEREASSKVAE